MISTQEQEAWLAASQADNEVSDLATYLHYIRMPAKKRAYSAREAEAAHLALLRVTGNPLV